MSTQAAPHPPRTTWEEFLDWCDEDTYAEWVEGEVQIMTAPGTKHQDLVGFLGILLRHFAEAHDLGRIFFGPFLVRLPRSGRLPDVIFIAREHLDRLGEVYLEGPLDLAIEIVTPESRTRDRREKLREYEEAGVHEYWIFDFERRQAEFYGLDDAGKYAALPVEDGIFRSVVLSGLWLKVEWLWQEPLPPLMSVLREWGLIR